MALTKIAGHVFIGLFLFVVCGFMTSSHKSTDRVFPAQV